MALAPCSLKNMSITRAPKAIGKDQIFPFTIEAIFQTLYIINMNHCSFGLASPRFSQYIIGKLNID